jgi:hypothetical protein
MSEYIILSSNVSAVPTFGKNTIAEFRTKLARSVKLEGNWVVGISEITYTRSWFNVLHNHKVILFDEMGQSYGSTDSNDINNTLDTRTDELFITAGLYETPQRLVGEINGILQRVTSIKPPKLYYN